MPRRRFMALCAWAGLAVGVGWQATGYRRFHGWRGEVLQGWEAEVLAAVAETTIAEAPGATLPEGPALRELAENVDRFLVALPSSMRREIHGLLLLVEHGTLLTGRFRRFTRLAPADRAYFLNRLHARGGLARMVAKGARDLCLSGWYQDERTWGAMGYQGPLVVFPAGTVRGADGLPARPSRYDHLRAPESGESS